MRELSKKDRLLGDRFEKYGWMDVDIPPKGRM